MPFGVRQFRDGFCFLVFHVMPPVFEGRSTPSNKQLFQHLPLQMLRYPDRAP